MRCSLARERTFTTEVRSDSNFFIDVQKFAGYFLNYLQNFSQKFGPFHFHIKFLVQLLQKFLVQSSQKFGPFHFHIKFLVQLGF